MRLEAEEAIEYLSQRTYNNTRDRLQKNRQRRNVPVDLYGVEYTRMGDQGTPATFYISISPDMVYLERFEFKLIVSPFLSTVGSGTSEVTVGINSSMEAVQLNLNNNQITPNPHAHTLEVNAQPHTHTLTSGITPAQVTAQNFSIEMVEYEEDEQGNVTEKRSVDITAYLVAQFGIDRWVHGQGIWPSIKIDNNYDILEVASAMQAEGKKDEADFLTHQGYKAVRISADGPFQVTLVLYAKYSHLNR